MLWGDECRPSSSNFIYRTMKRALLILVPLIVVGCSDSAQVVNVPNPNRIERKPYESMTVDEKIDFINKTPMPQDAKDKQIAALKAGGK